MRLSLIALAGLTASVAFTAAYGASKTEYGTWGFDTAAMDKSIKPGDDFFMYASGNWYKTAEIPA